MSHVAVWLGVVVFLGGPFVGVGLYQYHYWDTALLRPKLSKSDWEKDEEERQRRMRDEAQARGLVLVGMGLVIVGWSFWELVLTGSHIG